MTPIRIIRYKKPVLSCIGCGRIGVLFCSKCKEMNDAGIKKCKQILGTVEQHFAQRLT